MIKIPKLKVGTRLDILLENEVTQGNAHFMKALVYDLQEDKIITSQTSPALNRDFLNRRLVVSFLAQTEGRNLRFGFPATLADLLGDYKIASEKNVEALILHRDKESEPMEFRMYFRVKPQRQSIISLVLSETGEKVSLIDISLGGAKFVSPKNYSFRAADKIKFKLMIGSRLFDLETKVRNLWTPYDAPEKKNIQYVSIEFEYNDKQMESVLGKAILDIERQLLSEGKI